MPLSIEVGQGAFTRKTTQKMWVLHMLSRIQLCDSMDHILSGSSVHGVLPCGGT